MDIAKVHAAGIASVQAEAGDTCPQFAWNGSNWLCLPGGARRRKDLGTGGLSLDSDLQLTCLTAQFLGDDLVDAAAVCDAMIETTLVYLDQSYQIDTVTIAMGGQQLRLNCTYTAQGL